MEAIIGIAYAVATTSTVIILDKGAGSDVHIHDMLAGNILWVSWHQIFRLTMVIAAVAAFHYVFRSRFKAVTLQYRNRESGNLTFGIVIVEAVNIGGILTIFAFLIIPSSISALFATRWTSRILVGLLVGGLSAILGLYLSWVMDVPCSPTIILFLAVSLVISVLLRAIIKHVRVSGK